MMQMVPTPTQWAQLRQTPELHDQTNISHLVIVNDPSPLVPLSELQ
jgi:hypothetical protein